MNAKWWCSNRHSEMTTLEDVDTFFQEAVEANCEGLMVKTLNSHASYEPSKRSLNWLKIKKDYLEVWTTSKMNNSDCCVACNGFCWSCSNRRISWTWETSQVVWHILTWWVDDNSRWSCALQLVTIPMKKCTKLFAKSALDSRKKTWPNFMSFSKTEWRPSKPPFIEWMINWYGDEVVTLFN